MLKADDLIKKWIEPNPYRPGEGNVRLREYGVSVWALVGYGSGTDSDAASVAAAYDLPLEAVHAALAYYQRHRCAIDIRIADNSA